VRGAAENVQLRNQTVLDLEGVRLVQLVAQPERVALASPLQTQRLAVFGVDADARRHDLSGAGFGVQFAAQPPGSVVVGPDGSLRAARRGSSRLRVLRDGLSCEVPVEGQWPDVLVASDGVAAPGGGTPRLSLAVEGALRDGVQVQCPDLPSSAIRVLLAAPRPLSASPSAFEHPAAQVLPTTGKELKKDG
jgi:hypothetical protein